MKELLKRHYEKIVLASVLLILIASAGFLSFKVGSLSAEIQEAPRRPKPKGKVAESLDLGYYSNALVAINQPFLWTNSPVHIFETRRPGTPAMESNIDTNDLPVLVQVVHEPFKLLFMSYTGEGHNFQLNFLSRAKTFMVPDVGQEIADLYFKGSGLKTGYVIKKFTQKKSPPDAANPLGKDESELTIQHQGEDPIVLVLGRVAEQREPVARVRCKSRPQLLAIRRGQSFDCVNTTYNVVDITEKQMIIIDEKTGEKKEIPLLPSR